MREEIRPCDVTSIHADWLDCCLPDYFQGSDAEEVVCIPVWRGMGKKELYDALCDEFHAGDGYFSAVAGSGGMAEDAFRALVCTLDAGGFFGDSFPYCERDAEESESMLYVGLFAEIEEAEA